MHRRLAVVVAFVATATLGGSCTVSQPQPNLVGQDIRLTFIHTSDIHSRLFPYNFVPNVFDRADGLQQAPYGGIAKIATIAKRIRASSNRTLWLDSGDCFQGAPVFNLFKGEAEMRALSLAGMDAAVLGNHEFDLGAKNLFDKIDNWATFPLIAANYAWDDPPPGAKNRFIELTTEGSHPCPPATSPPTPRSTPLSRASRACSRDSNLACGQTCPKAGPN